MEISINSDIVNHIIQKARAFHVKEEVSFPYNSCAPSNDHDWLQVLADHYDDSSYQEAVETINKLDPSQQITLVALMYIGRGDYDANEWSQAYEIAEDHWTAKTGEYLLSRPLVADYLEEGLEQVAVDDDEE